MTDNTNLSEENYKRRRNRNAPVASGGIYGLAFIGATYLFYTTCNNILDVRIGFFKSVGVAGRGHLQSARISENVVNLFRVYYQSNFRKEIIIYG